MSRIRRSPFAQHEDPVEHMIELLSKEAENAGTPFDSNEKKILRSEASNREPVPEELRQKSKTLIRQLLSKEQAAATSGDPKSFNNSLGWAGDSSYPNIVALTEEVVTSGTGDLRLRGRRWAKDQIQLLGCAVLVILVMLLFVAVLSFVFHWK
jgi:hypothetical protein